MGEEIRGSSWSSTISRLVLLAYVFHFDALQETQEKWKKSQAELAELEASMQDL
jgi:hypothetical protein